MKMKIMEKEDVGKTKLKTIFEMLKQGVERKQFNESEMKQARIWLSLFVAGAEKGLWCSCTNIEDVMKRLTTMTDSLKKKLEYVV